MTLIVNLRLMKYLLSLRGSEDISTQNRDSVTRQDKDDSSADAHSIPVLTVKKWDLSICSRNPGSPWVKQKVIALQFIAHGNKDHKVKEQRFSCCKLSPTSCISLLTKTICDLAGNKSEEW